MHNGSAWLFLSEQRFRLFPNCAVSLYSAPVHSSNRGLCRKNYALCDLTADLNTVRKSQGQGFKNPGNTYSVDIKVMEEIVKVRSDICDNIKLPKFGIVTKNHEKYREERERLKTYFLP